MQEPPQLGRLLLGRHLAEGIQPSVEQSPLADGAVGQLRGQGAIGPFDGGALQLPLQGHIRIGPSPDRQEHLPGQLAGCQANGALALSRLGSRLWQSRRSVWSPEIAPQGQPPLGIHRDPLRDQHLPLDPITALTATRETDAAAGIHHPLPGHR